MADKARLDGKTRARVLLIDIENHDLHADYGWFICGCWKVMGEDKIHTVSLLDYPKYINRTSKHFYPNYDAPAVQEYIRQISDADILVGHYEIYHDFPYLQTRAVIHNQDTLPPDIQLQDTWSIAKHKMKFGSNRLASLERALNIKFHKTQILPEYWAKASWGHKPSLRYIVEHCKQDILVLEEAYKRIRGLSTTHPNVCLPGGVDGCTKCGAVGTMERRGRRITKSSIAQRYYCRTCRSWSVTALKRVPEVTLR